MTDTQNVRAKFTVGDVSTRPGRRRALKLLLIELERVRSAEEEYMLRIPENLQESEAYQAADYAVEIIADAITTLGDAY